VCSTVQYAEVEMEREMETTTGPDRVAPTALDGRNEGFSVGVGVGVGVGVRADADADADADIGTGTGADTEAGAVDDDVDIAGVGRYEVSVFPAEENHLEEVVDVDTEGVDGTADLSGLTKTSIIDSLNSVNVIHNAILASSRLRAVSYADPDEEFIQAEGYDQAFQLPTGQRDCQELRQIAKLGLSEAVHMMKLANQEVSDGSSKLQNLKSKLHSLNQKLKQIEKHQKQDIAASISAAYTEFDLIDYQIQWGGYDTGNIAYRTIKKLINNSIERTDSDNNLWKQARSLSKRLLGDLDLIYKNERDETRRQIDTLMRDYHTLTGHTVDETISGVCSDAENESESEDYTEMNMDVDDNDDTHHRVRYRDAAEEAGSTRTRNSRKIIDKYDEHGRLIIPSKRSRMTSETSTKRAKRKRHVELIRRRISYSGIKNGNESLLMVHEGDERRTQPSAEDAAVSHKKGRDGAIASASSSSRLSWRVEGIRVQSTANSSDDVDESVVDESATDWRHAHVEPAPVARRELSQDPAYSYLNQLVSFLRLLGSGNFISALPLHVLPCNQDCGLSTNGQGALDLGSHLPIMTCRRNLQPSILSHFIEEVNCSSRNISLAQLSEELGSLYLDAIVGMQRSVVHAVSHSALISVCNANIAVIRDYHTSSGQCQFSRSHHSSSEILSTCLLPNDVWLQRNDISFQTESAAFIKSGVPIKAAALLNISVTEIVSSYDLQMAPLNNHSLSAEKCAFVAVTSLSHSLSFMKKYSFECQALLSPLLSATKLDVSFSNGSLCDMHSMFAFMKSVGDYVQAREFDFYLTQAYVFSFVAVITYLELQYRRLLYLMDGITYCTSMRKEANIERKRVLSRKTADQSDCIALLDQNLRCLEIMDISYRLGLESLWDELVRTAMATEWLLFPNIIGLMSKLRTVGLRADIPAVTDTSENATKYGLPGSLWETTCFYADDSVPHFCDDDDVLFRILDRSMCPFVKVSEMFMQLWIATTVVAVHVGDVQSPHKLVHADNLTATMPLFRLLFSVDMCSRPWELLNKRIGNYFASSGYSTASNFCSDPTTTSGLCRSHERECYGILVELIRTKAPAESSSAAGALGRQQRLKPNLHMNVLGPGSVYCVDQNCMSASQKESKGNVGDGQQLFQAFLAVQALHTYALSVSARIFEIGGMTKSANNIIGDVLVLRLNRAIRTSNWDFLEHILLDNIGMKNKNDNLSMSSLLRAHKHAIMVSKLSIEGIVITSCLGAIWEHPDVGIASYLHVASVLLQFTTNVQLEISKKTPDAWDAFDVSFDHLYESLDSSENQRRNICNDLPMSSTNCFEEFVLKRCASAAAEDVVNGELQLCCGANTFSVQSKLILAMLASTLAVNGSKQHDSQSKLQLLLFADILLESCSGSYDHDVEQSVYAVDTSFSQSPHGNQYNDLIMRRMALVTFSTIGSQFGAMLDSCIRRDALLLVDKSSCHIRTTSLIYKKKEGLERLLRDCGPTLDNSAILGGLLMAMTASRSCHIFGFDRVDPGLRNDLYSAPSICAPSMSSSTSVFERNCFEQNILLRAVLQCAVSNSLDGSVVESLLVWLVCGCTMTGSFGQPYMSFPAENALEPSLLSCIISCIHSENIRNRSQFNEWKLSAVSHTHHTAQGVAMPVLLVVPATIRVLLLTTLSFCVELLQMLHSVLTSVLESCSGSSICELNTVDVNLVAEAFRRVWVECLAAASLCLDKACIHHAIRGTSLLAAVGLAVFKYAMKTLNALSEKLCKAVTALPTQTLSGVPNLMIIGNLVHGLTVSVLPSAQQTSPVPLLRDGLRLLVASIKHVDSISFNVTSVQKLDVDVAVSSLLAFVGSVIARNGNDTNGVTNPNSVPEDDVENRLDMGHNYLIMNVVDVLADINYAALLISSLWVPQRQQSGVRGLNSNSSYNQNYHSSTFRESLLILDISVKELPVLMDTPLVSWITCRFIGSFMKNCRLSFQPVEGPVTTLFTKDIFVPNLHRTMSTWLECVGSFSIFDTKYNDILQRDIGFGVLSNQLLQISAEFVGAPQQSARDLASVVGLLRMFYRHHTVSCATLPPPCGDILIETERQVSTIKNSVWSHDSFRRHCFNLPVWIINFPHVNEGVGRVLGTTNTSEISLLGIPLIIHRLIRYIGHCLFHLSSKSNSRASKLSLYSMRHSFKALLIALVSGPVSAFSAEECRNEITRCYSEYFSTQECGKFETLVARALIDSTTKQSSSSMNVNSSLSEIMNDLSQTWSSSYLIVRSLCTKGIAYASREQDCWIVLLRSLVRNWGLYSLADAVNPRIDLDSLNPAVDNAENALRSSHAGGHKLVMKVMCAWSLALTVPFTSTRSSRQFLSKALNSKSLNEILTSFNVLKLLGTQMHHELLSSMCECLECDLSVSVLDHLPPREPHSSGPSLITQDSNDYVQHIVDAVRTADTRLEDLRSYVLLSDTPWQVVSSTAGIASNNNRGSVSIASVKRCAYVRACMCIYSHFMTYLVRQSTAFISSPPRDPLDGISDSAKTVFTALMEARPATSVMLGQEMAFCLSYCFLCVQILRLLLGESSASVDANCVPGGALGSFPGDGGIPAKGVYLEAGLITQRLLLILVGLHTDFIVGFKARSRQLASIFDGTDAGKTYLQVRVQCVRLLALTCKMINFGVVASPSGTSATAACNLISLETLQCVQLFTGSIPECLAKVMPGSVSTNMRCRQCLCCVGPAFVDECKSQCVGLNDRLTLLQNDVVVSFNDRQSQISKFSAGDGRTKPRYSTRHIARTILKILTNFCD
jgi:hypothetical protein